MLKSYTAAAVKARKRHDERRYEEDMRAKKDADARRQIRSRYTRGKKRA